MQTLAEIADALSAPLKQRGYKKRALTWYRRFEHTTVVFAIRKSQFSSDVWYYNFGVGINSFFDSDITSISRCDILYRLDQTLNGVRVSPEHLIRVLELWETDYGKDLQTLRRKAAEDKLPRTATQKAVRYLTMNYPWHK